MVIRMRLLTYQSEAVLKILKKNQIYMAKPSISFKKEYGALIDILNLSCKCPIFTVVKGRKQISSGRVSNSFRLELEVPENQIKLTEFSVWADFMYGLQFTNPLNYKSVSAQESSELKQSVHTKRIEELKKQKPLSDYRCPQAILEEIKPEWLVSFKKISEKHNTDIYEKITNIFKR